MARKSKGKSSKDVMHRYQQGSARKANDAERTRQELAGELQDPARFSRYLAVFGQIALLLEPLGACRFPAPLFIPAVVRAAEGCELAPGPARLAAIRGAVTQELAHLGLLTACQAAIQEALQEHDDRDALLALTAAGALSSNCAEEDARPGHPFWEVLFQISLTEAVLSGYLLTYLVLESLGPDPARLREAFTRALAQGDLTRTLSQLGVDNATPTNLVAAYLESLNDPYHFQLDAVLRLVYAHVEFASEHGRSLASDGLPRELLSGMVEAWRSAFKAEVDDSLRRELRTWCKGRLEELRDDPEGMAASYAARGLEAERLRAAATLVALEVLEPSADPLLQAVHIHSLQRARRVPGEPERTFVQKLWGQPTDGFTLEEYERYLLSRGEANRSRRVHRFRDWVRTQVAPPAPPAPSVPERQDPERGAPAGE